jgi:hypothetical protein
MTTELKKEIDIISEQAEQVLISAGFLQIKVAEVVTELKAAEVETGAVAAEAAAHNPLLRTDSAPVPIEPAEENIGLYAKVESILEKAKKLAAAATSPQDYMALLNDYEVLQRELNASIQAKINANDYFYKFQVLCLIYEVEFLINSVLGSGFSQEEQIAAPNTSGFHMKVLAALVSAQNQALDKKINGEHEQYVDTESEEFSESSDSFIFVMIEINELIDKKFPKETAERKQIKNKINALLKTIAANLKKAIDVKGKAVVRESSDDKTEELFKLIISNYYKNVTDAIYLAITEKTELNELQDSISGLEIISYPDILSFLKIAKQYSAGVSFHEKLNVIITNIKAKYPGSIAKAKVGSAVSDIRGLHHEVYKLIGKVIDEFLKKVLMSVPLSEDKHKQQLQSMLVQILCTANAVLSKNADIAAELICQVITAVEQDEIVLTENTPLYLKLFNQTPSVSDKDYEMYQKIIQCRETIENNPVYVAALEFIESNFYNKNNLFWVMSRYKPALKIIFDVWFAACIIGAGLFACSTFITIDEGLSKGIGITGVVGLAFYFLHAVISIAHACYNYSLGKNSHELLKQNVPDLLLEKFKKVAKCESHVKGSFYLRQLLSSPDTLEALADYPQLKSYVIMMEAGDEHNEREQLLPPNALKFANLS